MAEAEAIASIVDEWLQGEPTPGRQQNMRRAALVRDLHSYFETQQRGIIAAIEEIGIAAVAGHEHASTVAAETMRRLAIEAVRARGATL